MFKVVVINQEKDYAKDFILKVRSIYDRMPWWLQKEITTDSKQELRFKARGNNGLLRAVVGSARAGRSMVGDLVIVDEASLVPFLDKTLQAIYPILDTTKGQLIQLSTSAGPQGPFYESWQETYGEGGELLNEEGVGPSGYKPIFLHYSMRPDRDEAWENLERTRLTKISPVAFKQEHPDTPEEAWEFAAGRVYAGFRRDKHVGDIEIPTTGELYRAIDWGQTDSPQVHLWLCHIPGPSALLISPSCPNTIREMFAYRWDPDDPTKPMKVDDHCPDALRYAVITFNLTGVVYVYREHYEKDSVAKGWNFMTEIRALHEMSGWIKKDDAEGGQWVRGRRGEHYEGSTADRSWPKVIDFFNLHGCEVVPHEPIRGKKGPTSEPFDPPLKEIQEAIRVVSALVDGTINLVDLVPVRRNIFARKVLAQNQSFAGENMSAGLQERAIHHEARRLLAALNKVKR